MFVDEMRVGNPRITNAHESIGLHTHDYYQLIYAQNSIGKIIIDETEYFYKPGCLYFAPKDVPHHCINEAGTDYFIFFFTVLDSELINDLMSLPYEIRPKNHLFVKYLINQIMLNKSFKSNPSKFNQYGYFVMLLTSIIDKSFYCPFSLELTQNSGMGIDKTMLNNTFDVLITFINSRFNTKIYIKDMSKFSGYTPAHLFRLFKEKFNMTPHRYVNSLRINYAKTLLETTSIYITDIAPAVGFQSNDTFTRAFRSFEGCSPSEYRKNFL